MLGRVLEVCFVNSVFFILVEKGAEHPLQFKVVAPNLYEFGLVEGFELEIDLEG